MNIKELLNKLRGNKNVSNSLILPNNLESIPMRDKLDDNRIKRLDEIKKKYEDILSQENRSYFNSYNLTNQKANDEMRINFSLFGKLVINHDEVYNLITMEYYEKENLYVHNLINPVKIKLYIDAMEELYVSTHLKLIALKEIYDESDRKERIFLTKRKKEALVNEIYNLTTNYVIFKNNVYSALVEVETYKKELKDNLYNDSDMRTFARFKEDTLSDYKIKVTEYARTLIPDRLDEIKKQKLNKLEEIASIERELEIYTYNNIKVEDLNKELENIDSIPRTAETRDNLLEVISKLETKFIVLNDYGRYELDLRPLYEVKFDILVTDIIGQEYSPFADMPRDRERIFYEDIIASRIVTNITGVDSLLSQWVGKQNVEFVPKIVKEIKSVLSINGSYDYDFLLNNRMNLSLILSMTSREMAKYFFDNYMLKCTEYGDVLEGVSRSSNKDGVSYAFLGINTDLFSLKPGKMPLISLCKIHSLWYDDEKKEGIEYCGLTSIYDYLFNYGDVLEIPEGIREINIYRSDNAKFFTFLENVRDCINNKELIMPSTLESLSIGYPLLNDTKIPKIVLNEGLKRINGEINFVDLGTKSLTIPSTLSIYFGGIIFISFKKTAFLSVPELIFTNYESSRILSPNAETVSMIETKVRYSIDEMRKVLVGKTIKQISELIKSQFRLPENSIILVSKDGTRLKMDIASLVWEKLLKCLQLDDIDNITIDEDDETHITYSESYVDEVINENRIERKCAIIFMKLLGRLNKGNLIDRDKKENDVQLSLNGR